MKKRIILISILFAVFKNYTFAQGNLGIGTLNPHPSALLELSSTDKGLLIPRMTQSQRDSISAPGNTLMIYNLTSKCIELWLNEWQKVWCYDSSSCLCCDTFIDSRDGFIYHYVQIGSQIWMCENLKYIPPVTGPQQLVGAGVWSNNTPFYYVYGYDGYDVGYAKSTATFNIYGVYYNWPAAMSGSASSSTNPSGIQGACPPGWHLPSLAEWTQMENYLANNGYNYDGTIGGGSAKIAKALSATNSWVITNVVGSPGSIDSPEYRNKSGFSALAAGVVVPYIFSDIGLNTFWWTATESIISNAWAKIMQADVSNTQLYEFGKERGGNIRCIKD